MTLLLLAFPAAALVSWLLTRSVRAYAMRRAILDVPNHRSSHALPTPRGGGLAIAAVVLAGTLAGALAGVVPPRLALAVVLGGGAVAWIGWRDDHAHVPARWRAAVHFAAAAGALACLGGLPVVRLGTYELALGPAGTVLAVLGTVWLTNLYNFMDGIDGIAGGEALTAALAGGVLLLASGAGGIALPALLLAGASLGFLLWNWSPARIFMGDVGSGMLGFLFAVLAVASENAGSLPLAGWMLLLGVFVVDATVTLVRRVARRERFYDAHRSHAYQRAVQAGMSHGRVSGGVVALNVALAAAAALAWRTPGAMLPVLAGAALLLGGAYLWVERLRPMYPREQPAEG